MRWEIMFITPQSTEGQCPQATLLISIWSVRAVAAVMIVEDEILSSHRSTPGKKDFFRPYTVHKQYTSSAQINPILFISYLRLS